MSERLKTATAVISPEAMQHNMRLLRSKAPHSQVWAMVKANAYGHGLLGTAKAVQQEVDGFGVARLEEALMLRSHAITQPIMLLEGFLCAADLPLLEKHGLETAVHCLEQVEALEEATLNSPIKVWIKIDTGMHRLGVRPEELDDVISRLEACPNVVKPLDFLSHFACADELDNPMTAEQIALFTSLTQRQVGRRSLAASSGLLFWQQSHFDLVRPGICVYGISPTAEQSAAELGLIPAMEMRTQLIAVRVGKRGESIGYGARYTLTKDTKLGVVAMGYGDGYPRNAPDGTPVYINGRIVPLVGRVSMDMLTVDLGFAATDNVGDEVILWGAPLPVEDVAQSIGTSGYELVTNLTSRVTLLYR